MYNPPLNATTIIFFHRTSDVETDYHISSLFSKIDVINMINQHHITSTLIKYLYRTGYHQKNILMFIS